MMGNMQIATNKVLRGLVLNLVFAAEEMGASMQVIRSALKPYGYSLEDNEIMHLCKYLEGKGLVKITGAKNEALKIDRHISCITSKGIDVLEGTIEVEGVELAV